MRPLLVLAVSLACGSAIPEAAAAPAAGTQNPQISYVKSARGYQLIVADVDGGGARGIYSSIRMLSGELGGDGRIYFWDGGRFAHMPATGGAAQTLFDTNRTIPNHSDLAPNGNSMAWFDSVSGTLFHYDFASGSQQPLASAAMILDLTFDFTGASVIYLEQVGDTDYELKSVPAGGGSPLSLGLVGRFSGFDSARRDDTLALTVNPAGAAPYVAVWKPGMAAPVKIADGYNPTYSCDDSAIYYNRMSSSGPALYRRTANGAISQVAKPSAIFASARPVC